MSQRTAPRWIPCSEVLPDDNMTVLVWSEAGDRCEIAYHEDDLWFSADGDVAVFEVTHWMDLPEGPR